MTTRCSKCGHENPASVGICVNCAAPLVNLCPNCSFENPPGHKFCGNCGANLLTATLARGTDGQVLQRMQTHLPDDLIDKVLRAGKQIEGERRNVTILFADIVGFTSLSERLDPEQVFAIIDQVQKAFLAEIFAHEGWFDKFLGDGLMAIFGAPVAHEDDPARAIRAALGMRQALKRINQDLERRLGIRLRIRLGLNDGSVVVANMGSDLRMNYTPLGDAVNVASRLQTMAEPGTLLVSQAVHDQCSSQFEFRELGSIRVKGRVEPVEIFEVLGPRRQTGRTRGIPGLNAPMVGRGAELERLRKVAEELARDRMGRMALVLGEAGIGKSRLTAEFKAYLGAAEVLVVESACPAYGQTPYDLVTTLLKALFGITPDDPESMARERIEHETAKSLGTGTAFRQVLPYLEYLLSIPVLERDLADRIRYLEPAQLRQQIFLAVRDLLLGQARLRPLVLILEDLHWVDKPSLDLLLFLLSSIESAPILFFCTSRPAEGQAVLQLDRLGRAAFNGRYVRLELDRLSPADSAALVELLLAMADMPAELKQMIPQRAEGNPFFVEEIVRMLIDRGVIRRSAGRWEITPGADLSGLEVPRTLQSLIMTRVDSLHEGPRHALQCAAVIGRTFSLNLLESVLEGTHLTEADLHELQDRELVERVARSPEVEYTFRHGLIQETVYTSLLSRRRERLHHRIAEGIERLYRDRLDDYIERLAYHYQQGRASTRALSYLIRAGERATRRYANDQAIGFFQSAAENLPQSGATAEQQMAVHEGLANVQYTVGNYDGALGNYREALTIAAGLTPPQPRASAELQRQIGRVYERKGDYVESLHHLQEAQVELDRDPVTAQAIERVKLYLDIGWVHYRRGELDEAYQWFMRSLEIAEGTDLYTEIGAAYNRLVPLFVARGNWALALAYGEKGLRLREKIGDTEGVARSYLNLGSIVGFQGEWDQAIEYSERGLELAQRTGRAYSITLALHNISFSYILKGDSARARQVLERGLHEAERSGDAHLLCLILNDLVQAALIEHQPEEALATAQRSLLRATETGNKSDLAETNCLLAEALLEQGQSEAAESPAQRSLAYATEAGLAREEGMARRVLGRVRRENRQWEAARSLLAEAMQIFRNLNNRYEWSRTQMEQARLARDQGQAAPALQAVRDALSTFSTLGAEADRKTAVALVQQMESLLTSEGRLKANS